MRAALDRFTTGLFAIAMAVFLLLAIALVLTQAVGILFGIADAIVLAESWFKAPAILAAVAVGILGFVLFNVRGEKPAES